VILILAALGRRALANVEMRTVGVEVAHYCLRTLRGLYEDFTRTLRGL